MNVVVKELSRNDTGETGGHQGGILIPKGEWGKFPNLPAGKGCSCYMRFHDPAGVQHPLNWKGYAKGEAHLTGTGPLLRKYEPVAGDIVVLELGPAVASPHRIYFVSTSIDQSGEPDHPPVADGRVIRRYVTTYERNPKLRRQALAIHGTACQCCGVEMADEYGEVARGLVDVHHLNPVSQGEQVVDPKRDLAVLCPNCHRVVHLGRPYPFTVAQVRAMRS